VHRGHRKHQQEQRAEAAAGTGLLQHPRVRQIKRDYVIAPQNSKTRQGRQGTVHD
jgi:hypothetical protein